MRPCTRTTVALFVSAFLACGCAPGRTEDEGMPLRVPAALRERTRFEPSGLAWMPGLDRFLVVSDDTGLRKADRERPDGFRASAPILFTLAVTGEVDPEPIRIEGLDSLEDAEGIAAGPEGVVYVLTSHGFSDHGRRGASRKRLLRLEWNGRTLRATGILNLLDLVQAAGTSALDDLGLTRDAPPDFASPPENCRRVVDLEGLTFAGGALVVGVKEPLTGEGRALVWKLVDPEGLFRSRRLRPGQLSLWATLDLSFSNGPRTTHEGIAELLFLPDGSLCVLGVAPVEDGSGGHGSVWVIPLSEGRAGAPRRVREIQDGNPEGIALTPDRKEVLVVLDRGRRTPRLHFLEWAPWIPATTK